MKKKYALIDKKSCVACGTCENVCPRTAIKIWKGVVASVDRDNCVGCGICSRNCPAGAINIELIDVVIADDTEGTKNE